MSVLDLAATWFSWWGVLSSLCGSYPTNLNRIKSNQIKPAGCKDLEIRKSELVAKTQFP